MTTSLKFPLGLLLFSGLNLALAPGQESTLPTSEGPAKQESTAPAADGAASPAKPAAPTTPTVITSEQFNLDMANHKGKFIEKVLVVGADFRMTSDDMDVTFTPENKVERLIAHGHVEITQPDRITHAGMADYFLPQSKIILTKEPEVIDKGNHVRGIKITVYRDTNRMEVEGAVKVVLPNDNSVSTPPPKPSIQTDGTK